MGRLPTDADPSKSPRAILPGESRGVSPAAVSQPAGAGEERTLSPGLWIEQGDGRGYWYELRAEKTSIGRDAGAVSFAIRDSSISRHHAVIQRQGGRWTIADLHSRNGTRVNGLPAVGPCTLEDGDSITLGACKFLFRLVMPVVSARDILNPPEEWSQPATGTTALLLPAAARQANAAACMETSSGVRMPGSLDADPEAATPDLLGKSERFAESCRLARSAAATNATVLLLGETGTGKELLARAIHRSSPRRNRPFRVVDCSALTPTLLHDELFGHAKGAFDGAIHERKGHFELADGGSIFLDEIQELPWDVQGLLRRAVELGEFYRLGGEELVKVDVRVICATNVDLEQAVVEKKFREDLLERLRRRVIRVPALRERPEDIPVLANSFFLDLRRENPRIQGFEPAVLDALCAHPWPRNVRQLRNVIHALNAEGPLVRLEDLPAEIRQAKPSPRPFEPVREGVTNLEDVERLHIQAILNLVAWNQSQAARLLGIDRGTLRQKLKKYQLQAP
ncbi:MAG: sigma 54-interacting transcriptional regulator [Planctomycetes bacterium]|nr:sigma 54-interacting transcriptional regulator [Planctomycetota bacterium]